MAPSTEAPGPAYRTISDVATLIGVPQHVLRFWETRFPQIAPLKRGGNRRYYRPEDIALLTRINRLLYTEGYTIKGVQKLLEGGVADAPGVAAAPARQPRPRVSTPVVLSPAPAAMPDMISGNASLRASIGAIRSRLAAAIDAAHAI
ncbi:MAG: MerR family transcriptional regulator [Janthinobacterium lividum]